MLQAPLAILKGQAFKLVIICASLIYAKTASKFVCLKHVGLKWLYMSGLVDNSLKPIWHLVCTE